MRFLHEVQASLSFGAVHQKKHHVENQILLRVSTDFWSDLLVRFCGSGRDPQPQSDVRAHAGRTLRINIEDIKYFNKISVIMQQGTTH